MSMTIAIGSGGSMSMTIAIGSGSSIVRIWLRAMNMVAVLGRVVSGAVQCIPGKACVVARSNACAGCSRGGELGVTGIVRLLVALPEWSPTSARRVVVRWRWSVALFSPMMPNKQDLQYGREGEEEAVDDGDGENRSVEFACAAKVGCVGHTLTATKSKAICAIARCARIGGPIAQGSTDDA